MTHYGKWASEEQRNDPALRAMVKNELKLQKGYLKICVQDLQRALTNLESATEITEDVLNERASTGLAHARFEIKRAINNFNSRIKILESPTETYISNITAFLSSEQVENLRNMYENSSD